MEFEFQWFWLVKLSLFLLIVFTIWKFVKSKFKSRLWGISSVILLILTIVSPIKLDVDTRTQTQFINTQIEQIKQLPDKIVDISFTQAKSKDITIQEKDLK